MHRLCERGGHLEHYLPNPELLTDQDVFLLIDYFFLGGAEPHPILDAQGHSRCAAENFGGARFG